MNQLTIKLKKMELEYNIIELKKPSNGDLSPHDLITFISNADIIISDYGTAWKREFITKVGDGHRGATLEFKDGLMTYGYNIKSKLVRKTS